MPRYRIDNVLSGRGPQCLSVRLFDCLNGRILHMLVAGNASGIVRAFVVVLRDARFIEAVDDIGALKVLLPKMRGTVSNLLVFAEEVKRPVRLVTRVALLKRATACKPTVLV